MRKSAKKSIWKATDCVWYWVGGAEQGEWCWAAAGTRDEIQHGGRVAVYGSTLIGPPEGPPSADRIAQVLR